MGPSICGFHTLISWSHHKTVIFYSQNWHPCGNVGSWLTEGQCRHINQPPHTGYLLHFPFLLHFRSNLYSAHISPSFVGFRALFHHFMTVHVHSTSTRTCHSPNFEMRIYKCLQGPIACHWGYNPMAEDCHF